MIDPSHLGSVRRVVGSSLIVELTEDIPSSSPIVDGYLYRVGQIGGYVKIPLGTHVIYGVVSSVGSFQGELSTPKEDLTERIAPPAGIRRWLEVDLIGESLKANEFRRGVGTLPTIDDPVHLVTDADLSAILSPGAGESSVPVGVHSASSRLPAYLNVDALVGHHAAVVGSTGSGKTNAVVSIIESLSDATVFPAARIVVIDIHGEYAKAFPGARVRRIGDEAAGLHIPYWALSFDQVADFGVDRRSASETVQDGVLRDLILDKRRANADLLKAGSVPPERITADSPVPYDIRDVWYELAFRNLATYRDRELTEPAMEDSGDPTNLIAPTFPPPGIASNPPHRGPERSMFNSFVAKLENRLRDPRYAFLTSAEPYDGVSQDLNDLLSDWVGGEDPITILDFSGAPVEVIDLAIGAASKLIFDVMTRTSVSDPKGAGRPLLLVCEEAHSYLPHSLGGFIRGYALRAVEQIVREGRKLGLGLLAVSQRPSELSETVLSQCGTIVALRLTNPSDQARVQSSMPDALTGMASLLPSLRTGEALVLGDSVPLPSRVQFARPKPGPGSEDPPVAARWKVDAHDSDFSDAITSWRKGLKPGE